MYFTLSFVGNPLHMNLNPVSDGHDQIIEAQAEHHTSQISDFFFLIFLFYKNQSNTLGDEQGLKEAF